VTDDIYVGFGGSGTLDLASGARVDSDTMSIVGSSSLRLHVDGDDMVVLGNAGSRGSLATNGLIGLYADAFLADGTYTPISEFSGSSVLWSNGGVFNAIGGVWGGSVAQTFDVAPATFLDAGDVHVVASNERLLITDAPSGDRVSVSFASGVGGASFSASVMSASDQAALEAILPADAVILGAWDFATNLTGGNEAFLAFEVENGLEYFRVWHLDGGVWSSYDPAFQSFDVAGDIAGFTVDGFSGYAVTTPEPGTLALLSIGGILALRRRRRRQK
jgi:hypothetical protein